MSLSGEYERAARQAWTNACCTASAASSCRPTVRRATVYIGPE